MKFVCLQNWLKFVFDYLKVTKVRSHVLGKVLDDLSQSKFTRRLKNIWLRIFSRISWISQFTPVRNKVNSHLRIIFTRKTAESIFFLSEFYRNQHCCLLRKIWATKTEAFGLKFISSSQIFDLKVKKWKWSLQFQNCFWWWEVWSLKIKSWCWKGIVLGFVDVCFHQNYHW